MVPSLMTYAGTKAKEINILFISSPSTIKEATPPSKCVHCCVYMQELLCEILRIYYAPNSSLGVHNFFHKSCSESSQSDYIPPSKQKQFFCTLLFAVINKKDDRNHLYCVSMLDLSGFIETTPRSGFDANNTNLQWCIILLCDVLHSIQLCWLFVSFFIRWIFLSFFMKVTYLKWELLVPLCRLFLTMLIIIVV